jgi:1-acyl-sn-glycerol-3-phosphate acyltransferase
VKLTALRRRGFPYTAPTVPRGVDRLPVKRKVESDFDTEWARRYPTRLARAIVLDTVTKPVLDVLASPDVDGLDRIEHLTGPLIFAANHASHVDTPLLLTTLPPRHRHRTVVAGAADYFFDKRWKGFLWSFLINAIPLERLRVSRRTVDLAESVLRDGWNLIIFPEGGRTPDGWAHPHTPGTAFLAIRTGVPVVPVHIEGTRRILRRGSNRVTPSKTHVTFGRPLRAVEGEDRRAFAARIEREVAILADEQASDWWTARRRASAGLTPALTGPAVGAWRRTWALGDRQRKSSGSSARWPKL